MKSVEAEDTEIYHGSGSSKMIRLNHEQCRALNTRFSAQIMTPLLAQKVC